MGRFVNFNMCVLIALLLSLSGGACAKDAKPGVERWPVKTSVMTHSRREEVSLTDLLALQDVPGVSKNDARYQSQRIGNFENADGLHEGDMVTTSGWFHLVAGETDGDYHIQISNDQNDGNDCLIVEVPKDDAHYTHSAALRMKFKSIRGWVRAKLLKDKEPASGGSVMVHPVYVRITGQLFYDCPPSAPMRQNWGIELGRVLVSSQ
ncbi:MAG: hypothetical protein RB191_21370 [Terriglobia bacterium]|nr:hypothetical protein [Terriglobia bacterium]